MDPALGAYGFRLHGVDGARRWLVPQAPGVPELRLRRVVDDLPDRVPVIDADHADLGLVEGVWFETRADSDTVTFTSPQQIEDAALVHPLLAPAAALHWLWRGHEALHAGAVLLDNAALLLLGDREAGKSTTLAAMAKLGYLVLSDDLVVVSPELSMPAGPRSIDRRPPAHRPRPAGGASAIAGETVRGGTRVRQTLAEAPATVMTPIRAWVQLGWGERCGIGPLPAAERIQALAGARRVRRLPGRPQTVLELAALPAYRLLRPRRHDQVAATVELVAGILG